MSSSSHSAGRSDSAQVRSQLFTALELDLIGPTQRVLKSLDADSNGLETESLDRLSSWYLTGLVPSNTDLSLSIENSANHAVRSKRLSLEAIGERYHQFRAKLMMANIEGLTSTYNRFHDPAETTPELLELRRLHGKMDQAVLQAYGWGDVPSACGFGLDYLDTEDNAQLPAELEERIDSGELFFWDATGALDFQGQLEAFGAISARRKSPWRYRWPDAVRDDVLAWLLALNAERYEEEVRLGLHSKAAKQAAKAAGAGGASGKRRGRPPKAGTADAPEASQVEQMGLGL